MATYKAAWKAFREAISISNYKVALRLAAMSADNGPIPGCMDSVNEMLFVARECDAAIARLSNYMLLED